MKPLIGVRFPIPQLKNKVMKLGEGGNGVASLRESKAGTGPTSADVGVRQGRAAKFVTTNFERLTDSLSPSQFEIGSGMGH